MEFSPQSSVSSVENTNRLSVNSVAVALVIVCICSCASSVRICSIKSPMVLPEGSKFVLEKILSSDFPARLTLSVMLASILRL